MSEKLISAVVIEQLKNALSNIYWYKNQLKDFMFNCIQEKKYWPQLIGIIIKLK